MEETSVETLGSGNFFKADTHILSLKSIIMLILSPYQFVSQNLNNRLVDDLLEVHSGVDLRGQSVCGNKGDYSNTESVKRKRTARAQPSASQHNVVWTEDLFETSPMGSAKKLILPHK